MRGPGARSVEGLLKGGYIEWSYEREGSMRVTRWRQRVVWRSWKPPGWEFCGVKDDGKGLLAKGTVVRGFREGVATIVYAIRLDSGWKTRVVKLEQVIGGVHLEAKIEAGGGQWLVDGRNRDDLEGCLDVDLGASPLTNTFPIKRTNPQKGEKIDLKVAWVRFPSLEVRKAEQSYERISEESYVYRSRTGFKAELRLDDFGLVSNYGDYWSAV